MKKCTRRSSVESELSHCLKSWLRYTSVLKADLGIQVTKWMSLNTEEWCYYFPNLLCLKYEKLLSMLLHPVDTFNCTEILIWPGEPPDLCKQALEREHSIRPLLRSLPLPFSSGQSRVNAGKKLISQNVKHFNTKSWDLTEAGAPPAFDYYLKG